MTDKDKIEVILKELWKPDCEDNSEAYNMALQDVQTAIDSMPDEPKFKVGNVVRSSNGTILKIIGMGQYCYHCDNNYSFGFNIQDEFELIKEPVIEDLKEASRKYEENRNDLDARSDNEVVRRAFVAGAKWQKHQMMEDAIDAFIDKGSIRLRQWPLDEKYGRNRDKIKLIVIKEK